MLRVPRFLGCRTFQGLALAGAPLANWLRVSRFQGRLALAGAPRKLGRPELGRQGRRLSYRDQAPPLANGGILRSAIGHSVKALAACHGSPNVAIRSIRHTNSTGFSSIFGSRRP